MDLDLVKSFVAVVDAGGFTKAGGRVHKTQSTVSQQIGRLEDYLGQPLLKRDSRTVALTDHGAQYLPYARRLLALEEEARSLVGAHAPYRPLRLGVPEDFTVARLPNILRRFARHHPSVRLEVTYGLSVHLRTLLDDGRLDITVMKEAELPVGAVHRWTEPLRWVEATSSPAPHLLRPLPLIAFPQGCVYRLRATTALDQVGIPWRIAYESPNWVGNKAALEAGLGVAVMGITEGMTKIRTVSKSDGLPPVAPTHLSVRAAALPKEGPQADLIEWIARLVPEERSVKAARR